MSELHRTLQGLHEELRRAERLEPGDRALLESLLGDIRRLLDAPQPAPALINQRPHRRTAMRSRALRCGWRQGIRESRGPFARCSTRSARQVSDPPVSS